MRIEPLSPSTAIASAGSDETIEHARAQRVVDVVVDVGDAVDDPHDPALERRGPRGAPGVTEDAVANARAEVQPDPIALEHLDDPQRLLVVTKAAVEALTKAGVDDRLADMAERRVAEIVSEPDRLDEILVEGERTRDRARDLRDLERMGHARAVVVALGRHEDLRLVLEAPERLAVHDAVAVALQRGAQRAVGLLDGTPRRI